MGYSIVGCCPTNASHLISLSDVSRLGSLSLAGRGLSMLSSLSLRGSCLCRRHPTFSSGTGLEGARQMLPGLAEVLDVAPIKSSVACVLGRLGWSRLSGIGPENRRLEDLRVFRSRPRGYEADCCASARDTPFALMLSKQDRQRLGKWQEIHAS